MIFDNSEGKHEVIATKSNENDFVLINEIKFNKLKNYYYERIQAN